MTSVMHKDKLMQEYLLCQIGGPLTMQDYSETHRKLVLFWRRGVPCLEDFSYPNDPRTVQIGSFCWKMTGKFKNVHH